MAKAGSVKSSVGAATSLAPFISYAPYAANGLAIPSTRPTEQMRRTSACENWAIDSVPADADRLLEQEVV
jgi:hypothetical protein